LIWKGFSIKYPIIEGLKEDNEMILGHFYTRSGCHLEIV
jgi:hypothetical protein